jgi:ankyrin repeat protein
MKKISQIVAILIVIGFVDLGVSYAQHKSSNKSKELIEAAKVGDISKVRTLLEQGAEINAKDPDGKTVLAWVSAKSHINIANLLIDKGANVNEGDNDNTTPLVIAVATGNIEMVKVLLSHDANPNVETKSGLTPIYIVASQGYEEIAVLLLQKGADPNKKSFGLSPLVTAAAKNNWGVAAILNKYGAVDESISIKVR